MKTSKLHYKLGTSNAPFDKCNCGTYVRNDRRFDIPAENMVPHFEPFANRPRARYGKSPNICKTIIEIKLIQ